MDEKNTPEVKSDVDSKASPESVSPAEATSAEATSTEASPAQAALDSIAENSKAEEVAAATSETKEAPAPTPTTESKPAETPATQTPAPATPASSTAPATPASSVTPAAPAVPKPKSKKLPVIIACSVCGALAIGGGVFAIVHSIINSSPEKIAADAMMGLMQAENLTVSGDINVSSGDVAGDVTALKVAINTKKQSSNVSTNAKLTLEGKNGKTISSSTNFDTVAMGDDGALYLKLSGLKNAFSDLGEIADDYGDTDDVTELNSFSKYASDFLDGIEGTWWRLSVDEIFKMLYEQEDKKYDSKAADCLKNEIKNISSSADKYAKAYRDNPFVSIEKTDRKSFEKGDDYLVKFDADKVISFIKATGFESYGENISSCIKSADLPSNFKIEVDTTVEDEAIRNIISQLPEIHFGISSDHKLIGLTVNYKAADSAASMKLKLNFDYPEKLEVSAPRNSKSIVEYVKETINKLMTTFSETGITDCTTNSLDSTNCKTIVSEDYDFSDLIEPTEDDTIDFDDLFDEYEDEDDEDEYDL